MELKLNRKKTVKIIDNFLFRNEYDLLEIRLRTHQEHFPGDIVQILSEY